MKQIKCNCKHLHTKETNKSVIYILLNCSKMNLYLCVGAFYFCSGKKNFERNVLVPNRCAASFVHFCPLLSTFRVARKLCPCCCFIFSKTQCHTENTTPSRVDRRNTRSYTQRKGMRKHKYRHRERSYGRARTRSRARCCAGTANSGKFPTGWTVDKLLAKGYMRSNQTCLCSLSLQ